MSVKYFFIFCLSKILLRFVLVNNDEIIIMQSLENFECRIFSSFNCIHKPINNEMKLRAPAYSFDSAVVIRSSYFQTVIISNVVAETNSKL